MSSLITGIIPRRGYEIIRDRICQILLEEIQNQFVLTSDQDLNITQVFMERMVPFDFTELPALNVGLERGDYSNQHQGQYDGDYRFFFECNTRGETDGDDRGDMMAKVKVQKLMGVAQAILENPIYKTLGFTPGQLIKHRHVESFVFAESTRQDAENITMARSILVVKSVEVTDLIEANLIQGYDTRVKLYETEKGYYWSVEQD